MSSIRSNRSNVKEQQKPKKIGIRELRKMSHERILKKPQAYLDKLEELLFEHNRITAAELIFKLASEEETDQEREQQQAQERQRSSRPSIIDKWEVEFRQQQREKQEKAAREAAEAQQAAAYELGQAPEPDPAPKTEPEQKHEQRPQPQVPAAFTNAFMRQVTARITQPSPAGQHSNSLANEIGLHAFGSRQAIYS